MNSDIDFSQLPLHDIHLPGAVAWWPPAFGWWLLAALVLGALGACAVHYYRGRHHRTALRALHRVRTALEQGAEPVGCLQSVSTVLRRFAMTTAQHGSRRDPIAADAPSGEQVAGLVGERWLKYLDSRWQRDAFMRGAGRLLLAAPYARPSSVERLKALELTALCSEWLKGQPRSRRRPSRQPIVRRAAPAEG
jgi:uncharacterized protein DUF4381